MRLPMNDGLSDVRRQQIIDVLKTHPAVVGIVLFGSRAMGTYKPASDVDICLQGQGITMPIILGLMNSIDELNLPIDVDLIAEHTIQSADLRRHISSHGRTWWQRS